MTVLLQCSFVVKAFASGMLQADRNQLAELRQYQQRVRLSDDVAVDIVKEAARTQLEAALDAAVEVTNRRTRQRDNTDAIAQALHRFLALPLSGNTSWCCCTASLHVS